MELTEFTTTVLTAKEGTYLTQTEDVDIRRRIVATKVALGKNSSPEEWKEISEEEGNAIREKQDKLREEEELRMREEMTQPRFEDKTE